MTPTATTTLSRTVRMEPDGTWTAVVVSHLTGATFTESGFTDDSDATCYAEALEWELLGRPGLDT